MWSNLLTETAEAGRVIVGVITLGISNVFNGGISPPEHHCLELWFMCRNCQKNDIVITINFGIKGSELCFGEYLTYFNMESHNINISYDDLCSLYENDWKFGSNIYCAIDFNCTHYTYWLKDAIFSIVSIYNRSFSV
jgi:hypothetical protein